MTACVIQSLHVKNFLHYTEYSIKFNDGPNIIYGLNGDGKSSLMCAIYLGLGGRSKILNPSKKLKDYILPGKNLAEIEIKIFLAGLENTINMIISNNSNRLWLLNDYYVEKRDVIDLIKRYNINVDILCNFLLKDRIAEFTKMNPSQILIATEEMLNDKGLLKMHHELINLKTELNEKEFSINEINKMIENIEEQLNSFGEKRGEFEELFQAKSRLKYLEEKLNWQLYKQSQIEYNDIQREIYSTKITYDITRDIIKGKTKEIKLNNKLIGLNEIDLENCKFTTTDIKIPNHLIDPYVKEGKISCEIINKYKIYQDTLKKLEELKKIQESLKTEYNNEEPDICDILDSRVRLIQKKEYKKTYFPSKITKYISSLENKMKEYNIIINNQKENIKLENDTRNRFSEIIKEYNEDAYRALQWLNFYRNLFNGKIYDPLILHIRLKNSEDAKYIESHITKRDLFSFMCESNSDLEIFEYHIRKELSLNISCIIIDKSISSYESVDTNIIKNMKFRCFLKDLFIASDVAMSFLCQTYNVHNIPIFDEIDQKELETIVYQTNIRNFYTLNEKYTIKMCQNSNNPDIEKTLLRYSIDFLTEKSFINFEFEKHNDIKAEINLKANKMKEEVVDQCNKIAGLMSTKIQVFKKKNRIDTIYSEMSSNKKKIKICKIKLINQRRKINKLLFDLSSCDKIMQPWYTSFYKTADTTLKNFKDIANASFQIFSLNNSSEDLRSEIDSLNILLIQHKQRLFELSIREITKLNETNSLCERAKILCGMSLNENNIPSNLVTEYSKLPDSIDSISTLIKDLTSLNNLDKNIEGEIFDKYFNYRNQQVQYESLIVSHLESIKSKKCEEQELKLTWINSLNQLINVVNHNFQLFFDQINCYGSLRLYQDPTDDYTKYSLKIIISFIENRPPIQMIYSRHSEEEKAITTFLYLMSLQEISMSPFIMVDEIYNGIDQIKDKKFFNILIKTISQLKCTPQSIILSSKFTPDMDFADTPAQIYYISDGS